MKGECDMKKKPNIRKFLLLFSFCFVLMQAVNIAVTGHWFSLTAYAEEEIHYEDADQDGYPDSIDKAYEKFAYDFYKDVVGNDVAQDCIAILDGTMFTSYGLEGVMESLYNALKTIGIALMTTYFLMELMDKVTREQFDVETLIRMLIKFIIAKTLIMDNGITILKAFLQIGNGMAATVSVAGAPAGVETFLHEIVKIIQTNNMVMDVVMGIVAVIPWLISKLVGLVIRAICYGRLIDIVVRGGFAPIGCCAIVQEGFSGHGIRYLKKYFGSILQGAVIMGILFVCSSVNAAVLNAMFDSTSATMTGIGGALAMIVEALVVGFTEIMCIVKSGQIANEVAGV